jgi:dihydrofolate reductase
VGQVVASIGISLDGFIEGPERQIDWHRIDAELHRYLNDSVRPMAAFLEGRVTYELMEAYWPTADADPAASPEIVDFARIWRAMPKVVFSRTLASAGGNATVRRSIEPDEIRAFAEQGDVVIGGADIITAFRERDLVDEYRIFVHPVLIGRGKRLFPDTDAPADLRLIDTHRFGNGVVLLTYARERSTA